METVSPDFPAIVLTATIWVYWFTVGAMIVRARRRTRHLAGLVPEQRLEKFMWIVWVPLVAAWMVLPLLSVTRVHPSLAAPDFALRDPSYAGLRWAAAACAVACFALTARCWARMGRHWRMDVSARSKGELIMDGPFARTRHPIYALSMLLMVCSAVIVATPPMLVIAIVHLVLMNVKARNEERHLLAAHGEAYARYLQRTGRFIPRFGAPGS